MHNKSKLQKLKKIALFEQNQKKYRKLKLLQNLKIKTPKIEKNLKNGQEMKKIDKQHGKYEECRQKNSKKSKFS